MYNCENEVDKWMNATEKLQNKYNHYLADLNYPVDNVKPEIITNTLVTKVLNEMLDFVESQPNKIFVYDYNDDLPSLIGYKLIILCRSQSNVDFELRLLGKAKRTKKQLQKRQKFISEKKVKKNLNNYALISSFNPIYEVMAIEKSSKVFNLNNSFNVIRQFTPMDFFICKKFYGIKDFKYDWFSEDLTYMESINSNLNDLNKEVIWTGSLNPIRLDKIDVVLVPADDIEAIKVLQQVQDSDTIVYYFYDEQEDYDSKGIALLYSYNYSYYVKNKTNIPSKKYRNINNYEDMKYYKDLGIKLNLIGFSTDKYFDFIGR